MALQIDPQGAAEDIAQTLIEGLEQGRLFELTMLLQRHNRGTITAKRGAPQAP
ncbi:hypothetical protein [Streptomyces sp. NPDC059928]|uniref:hypothetical protein n=1 Tax=unclassified Streptomyces TaxID=2593676 RepID=UPI0036613571